MGLESIAIGFAFKDIIENFFAEILILFPEPFQLYDFIECQNFEGFVEEISMRDTHIRLTDGQRVVMPNAMLFKNRSPSEPIKIVAVSASPVGLPMENMSTKGAMSLEMRYKG